ncbi:hypothetical protein VTJ83DRAFT_1378 [Remersonia thermophila]|uniref:Ecp2 effector protein-like domain-containing protein n=1 Tax=Remersonia thermophila TaxID=72144 RepID=A0ABR4DP48_9PEZI
MQIPSLLTVLAAASAVSATTTIAAPVSSPNSAPSLLQARAGLHCYENLWEQAEMGGTAPSIEDCQRLADSLSGAGEKEVDGYNRPYGVNGTCAFVVRLMSCIPEVPGIPTFIGDKDVQRVIRDSIAKWGRDGRIGGRGFIRCNFALEYVEWIIQRNFIWPG